MKLKDFKEKLDMSKMDPIYSCNVEKIILELEKIVPEDCINEFYFSGNDEAGKYNTFYAITDKNLFIIILSEDYKQYSFNIYKRSKITSISLNIDKGEYQLTINMENYQAVLTRNKRFESAFQCDLNEDILNIAKLLSSE